MKTDRLFKDNVYLKETRASVTSVSQRNGKTLITLDKTIFFPTGGRPKLRLETDRKVSGRRCL